MMYLVSSMEISTSILVLYLQFYEVLTCAMANLKGVPSPSGSRFESVGMLLQNLHSVPKGKLY